MSAERDLTSTWSDIDAITYPYVADPANSTSFIPKKEKMPPSPVEEESAARTLFDSKIISVASSAEDDVDIISLMEYLQAIFTRAEAEEFADGEESIFYKMLSSAIVDLGNVALISVAHILRRYENKINILCETLKILGDIEHEKTHRSRLKVLEKYLHSPSDYVRDAASLGLASIDDPLSITAIEEAIQREVNDELKEDLQLVLDQLLTTQQCLTS